MPLFRRFKRICTLGKGEGEGDEELAMSNEQLVMSYEGWVIGNDMGAETQMVEK